MQSFVVSSLLRSRFFCRYIHMYKYCLTMSLPPPLSFSFNTRFVYSRHFIDYCDRSIAVLFSCIAVCQLSLVALAICAHNLLIVILLSLPFFFCFVTITVDLFCNVSLFLSFNYHINTLSDSERITTFRGRLEKNSFKVKHSQTQGPESTQVKVGCLVENYSLD